ncbi:MAG: hypothetical protein ACM3VT_18270 [Solirubrobacterales bacterium]|jgi:hypothetical protein
MRALYSLVCRLRTVHALAQGMITLTLDGWTAVTPGQLLVLGCGLCILVRVLVPSPRAGCSGPWRWVDHALSTTAATAVIGLTASETACVSAFAARLALGP